MEKAVWLSSGFPSVLTVTTAVVNKDGLMQNLMLHKISHLIERHCNSAHPKMLEMH